MSIQEYLPEKSFFITIGTLLVGTALVLLIAAGIKYQKNKPEKETIVSQNRLVTNEQALKNLQILETLDSDNDGLYDWEEALWGTNPLSADTDEDGIADFDEVDQVKVEYNLEANATPEEELTQLDIVSRDLYSTIAILDQQGKLEESESDIMQLFQQVVLQSLQYDPVILSDLALTSDSIENRDAYRTRMKNLIARYVGGEDRDLVFISNSSSKIQKTQEALDVVTKYQSFLQEALEVQVPVGNQDQHIDILNTIKAFATAIEAVLYADQDPLAGASGAVQLKQILADYYSLLAQVAS